MSQLGSGRMGGIPLAAGLQTQNFLNMPKGPINTIYLDVTITGKQTVGVATGFALNVDSGADAGAEGVDDMDLLLDAIFNSLALFWEPDNICGVMKPSHWRTILGMLNQRDFGGTFRNGAAVPAANALVTFHVLIPFPVSLDKYFADGEIFTQGSERIKRGQLDYNVASTTPTVVLANGSFTVTALAVSLNTESGIGTVGDVGPTWRVNRYSGLPTIYDFPALSGGRIALLDTTPPASSTISAATVGENTLQSPSLFQGRYQADRLHSGGYDITFRATPFIFLEQKAKFMDFVNLVNRSVHMDVIGPSSMSVIEVQAVAPSGTAIEAVATAVGGGGAVGQENPSPPSLPRGSRIPGALTHMAPVRILPGGVGVGNRSGNAVAAGNLAEKRKQIASASAAKFFRR